jgi:hypothetical protein
MSFTPTLLNKIKLKFQSFSKMYVWGTYTYNGWQFGWGINQVVVR